MAGQAGDFFIVDNSDEHWKALEYVRQWCQISSSIDIATGFFEIGSLLSLDGEWQKVDRIRVLIGAESSRRTSDALQEARQVLERSLESERQADPFLRGLAAVVQAIRDGKVQVKVYRRKKFHAKAYITHSRLDVVGSAALVGSSNFTVPGLTRNVELNVRFDGLEVQALQDWFEQYWQDAEDAQGDLVEVLERHNRTWTPFEVYAKALQALTANVEPGAAEWEQNHSKIYPLLAPYQREGYHGLKQRAAQWRGGFLTDGVGLGKTFVGLMLAEFYAVKERKNVLILATKTGQDAVWEPELRRRLPELTGEFTNVRVMAHTDLSRDDAPERAAQLADRVDVVIIDEAHNFRNRGQKRDDGSMSRWWRLQEITAGKTVFLLTATPINNNLFDLVHQIEIFTGAEADDHFAALGIPSLRTYMTRRQRAFIEQHGPQDDRAAAVEMEDFDELIEDDKLLRALIVQNSRKYAQASSKAAESAPVLFPDPDMPRAVPYDYNLAYNRLLEELEKAFEKRAPLFTLPMYYPLAYSTRDDVDTLVENRQKQVVGLIRTTFLKRFESSVAAFAGSCIDLAMKIAQWVVDNAEDGSDYRAQVLAWEERHRAMLAEAHRLFRSGIDVQTLEDSEDLTEEALEEIAADRLNPDEYDLPAMFDAALEDLQQLSSFIDRTVQVGEFSDTKYEELRKLLTGKRAKQDDPEVFDKVFSQHKVLVFTEFADTARYLHDRLVADGVTDVDRLDGSRKSNRVDMIRRFAPHYNQVDSDERVKLKPLRVLISTDVLSEGVNLQDAGLIINYDIHWNPVRLMQRIGRIDRRMNANVEQAIIAETPKVAPHRGKVKVRNFLPPEELNRILKLYARVQSRALLISRTLGIPGGRLLSEDDILDDVKVFEAFLDDYVGSTTTVEDLRLHYLELLQQHPGLEDSLALIPAGAYAAKHGPKPGLFACTIEPIRTVDDDGNVTWTLTEAAPRWALQRPDHETVDSLGLIDQAVRCSRQEPGIDVSDRVAVTDQLARWREDRREELMKTAGLPLDAPQPTTVCWMEIR